MVSTLERLKKHIKKRKDGDSLGWYWFYLFLMVSRRHPFIWWAKFPAILIYSYYVSFRMFGVTLLPKVSFPMGTFKIDFVRSYRAEVRSSVPLAIVFDNWRSGGETKIWLGTASTFQIENTFSIGDGCKISLERNAFFSVKGKSENQPSGITCDTIILCKEKISLGLGVIISWGCYISDSSQHEFNGVLKVLPVRIGDHVWISEGVTCAPGTDLGDGSVVGAKSMVSKKYPARVFLAGCPAEVKKTDVTWAR